MLLLSLLVLLIVLCSSKGKGKVRSLSLACKVQGRFQACLVCSLARSTNVPRSQLVLERAVAPCIPGHEIRRSRARNASPHIDVRASGMQSMLRDSTI